MLRSKKLLELNQPKNIKVKKIKSIVANKTYNPLLDVVLNQKFV